MSGPLPFVHAQLPATRRTPSGLTSAEQKILDLMAALETSVREAKEARDRHRLTDAGRAALTREDTNDA